MILRQRFLQEIGQYLPSKGKVLDVGCGFGLFSLYYAMRYPELSIDGIDLNKTRIQMARDAATSLGVTNVWYRVGNVTEFKIEEGFQTVYMLDIIHHLPRMRVRPLLEAIYASLTSGGTLLIKDVNTSPIWKRWFTWYLDKAMDFRTPVSYWSQTTLVSVLNSIGFSVFTHEMVDTMPYPHVLYICHKKR